MKIPFTKAHGAKNDFLLTWAHEAPDHNLAATARALCDRHVGVGADGWILVEYPSQQASELDGAIRVFNSDGSEPEISGNGTRCAAAFLLYHGLDLQTVRIHTGAGTKYLRLLERVDLCFSFEMDMGIPQFTAERSEILLSDGTKDVTIVWVGNPQCAVPVENFDFDWRKTGAEIESHPQFPNRTNVSFFRALDAHTLEVRFFERGAGETMSSGTGSTGAAAAAMVRGLVESPVTILTPAGPLQLRWSVTGSGSSIYLEGPAEIIAAGNFFCEKITGNG